MRLKITQSIPTRSDNHRIRDRLVLVVILVQLAAGASRAGAQTSLSELNNAIVDLTAAVSPAVVQVLTRSWAPAVTGGGISALSLQGGMGSGVIISTDGFVVTNAHVVAGAAQVEVQLAEPERATGQSILPPQGRQFAAEVLGVDAETDLALLKIDAADLSTLELADSDLLRQGQVVLAVGSPLGLENSVSMGVVSSIARQLEPDSRMIYIQTDAPINPGNSGGPLIDIEGRVVGINTLNLSGSGGSAGLGFAVPSNIVNTVIAQLMENGVFIRGEIGAEAQTITAELAQGLNLDRDRGVVLSDVLPGTSAEAANLRIGDIVVALNGKPMENARQFHVNLYQQAPGQVVRLDLIRAGEEISRNVAVRPPQRNSPEAVARLLENDQRLVPPLGILAVPVNGPVQDLLPGLRMPDGVLVTNLVSAPTAPGGAFLPGDVLFTLNGEPIRSLDALDSMLINHSQGESVVFQVQRLGRISFVVVPLY